MWLSRIFYFSSLVFVYITISIPPTVARFSQSKSKMDNQPIYTATEVIPGQTIQVDMDTIHRMAAEKIAGDEQKKSDELHRMTKKHYQNTHDVELKRTKDLAAEDVKQARAVWLFNNPEAASLEYYEEKKRLDDSNQRLIQKEESNKRMKIQAETQAALDYATTHKARMESRKQLFGALAYGMIGGGLGLLFMRSNM